MSLMYALIEPESVTPWWVYAFYATIVYVAWSMGRAYGKFR